MMIHPHLLEQVLRQLGRIQGESTLPPFEKPTCEATDDMFADFHFRTIRVTPSKFLAWIFEECMMSFTQVLHPRVISTECKVGARALGVILLCLMK